MSKTTLDESLECLYRIAADTELKADRSDPYAFDGVAEAKQATLRWVADEVVGEMEETVRTKPFNFTADAIISSDIRARNSLRAEQREILSQHGYKGGQR